eukprot:m51a1_g13919 hypothetical protein (461) ;mRNA; f:811604-813319
MLTFQALWFLPQEISKPTLPPVPADNPEHTDNPVSTEVPVPAAQNADSSDTVKTEGVKTDEDAKAEPNAERSFVAVVSDAEESAPAAAPATFPTKEPADVAVATQMTRADCGVVEERCPFLEFRRATVPWATDGADISDVKVAEHGGVISAILKKMRALVRKARHDPDADISPGLAKFFRRVFAKHLGQLRGLVRSAEDAAKSLCGLIGESIKDAVASAPVLRFSRATVPWLAACVRIPMSSDEPGPVAGVSEQRREDAKGETVAADADSCSVGVEGETQGDDELARLRDRVRELEDTLARTAEVGRCISEAAAEDAAEGERERQRADRLEGLMAEGSLRCRALEEAMARAKALLEQKNCLLGVARSLVPEGVLSRTVVVHSPTSRPAVDAAEALLRANNIASRDYTVFCPSVNGVAMTFRTSSMAVRAAAALNNKRLVGRTGTPCVVTAMVATVAMAQS